MKPHWLVFAFAAGLLVSGGTALFIIDHGLVRGSAAAMTAFGGALLTGWAMYAGFVWMEGGKLL